MPPSPAGSKLGGVSLSRHNGWKSSFVLPLAWPPYKLAFFSRGDQQDGPSVDTTLPSPPLAQGACLSED